MQSRPERRRAVHPTTVSGSGGAVPWLSSLVHRGSPTSFQKSLPAGWKSDVPYLSPSAMSSKGAAPSSSLVMVTFMQPVGGVVLCSLRRLRRMLIGHAAGGGRQRISRFSLTVRQCHRRAEEDPLRDGKSTCCRCLHRHRRHRLNRERLRRSTHGPECHRSCQTTT